MAQAAVRKVSFNGGIMSPYLDGRFDLARFQTGCIHSTNQIPCDWGGSTTRPGLVYDARMNSMTVLHPYIVSAAVSYLLLFSHQELRIVRDNQIIQVDGSDLVIPTPFDENDLYELKLDSLIDLTWITHPAYMTKQLTRISNDEWVMQDLPLINPPMIPRAAEEAKITPSGETGNITLTASEDLFKPGHVGSSWRIGYDLGAEALELSLSAGNRTSGPIIVHGDWSFTTSGNWRGTVIIERDDIGDGSFEEIRKFKAGSDQRNVATTGSEDSVASLRMKYSSISGGVAYNPQAVIEVSNSKIYGLVKITGYVSATEVTATVVKKLHGTTETNLWEEGAWSDFRGYPAAVAVHERRLMFSASAQFPNRYWSSAQDDRQSFRLGDETEDALSFDLPARDVVTWMISDRQLVVGTRREEVIISSGRDDLPLSPENSIARVNGSIGSSRVAPVKSSNAILYAERRGRRIRELVADSATDELSNTDVSSFAPHLFDANIIQMATAQLDQKLVFVLLSNRKLLAINHNRDQAMASWFVIDTKGDFESVASLPGDQSEDIVYVITRRTINSQEVRQLEHFAVDQWDLVEAGDPKEMVYSDMARTFESAQPVMEITGIDDWEGEEVQVLGDGAVQPNKTVTGGKIDLTHDSSTVVLGLPYKSKFTPMWFEDINSPSQGRKRKIAKVYTSMYKSGNVSITSTDEDAFGVLTEGQELDTVEVPRRNTADLLNEAPKLESGYFNTSLESRHSSRQSITFERDSPLPMIIQSLHLIYDVGDK